MTLTLDATVGGASSNAYNTLAEITSAAERVLPVPGWADVPTARRTLVAVMAGDLLDRMRFIGDRVDETQAMEWPRSGVWNRRESALLDQDAIPAEVKLAHARLALWLADQDDSIDPFQVQDADGVQSIDFGQELSMTFEKGAGKVSSGDRFLRDVIRPILGRLVLANQPNVVRG